MDETGAGKEYVTTAVAVNRMCGVGAAERACQGCKTVNLSTHIRTVKVEIFYEVKTPELCSGCRREYGIVE